MRSFIFSVTAILTLAAAATASATATTSSSAPTLHSRLSELSEAFRYNLITKEEFAKTKAEVLAAFASSPAKLKLQPTAEAEAEGGSPFTKLVFSDDFTGPLDLEKWEHEITMGGGGNWEFECRSNAITRALHYYLCLGEKGNSSDTNTASLPNNAAKDYLNNRSNSFTRNGTLFLKPTLTSDTLSEAQVVNGGSIDLWGSQPADICTGNSFFGCSRASNGVNIINPIQSARIRTAKSFGFKYGRVEVRAKLPKGDWIWPAIWMLPQQQAYGKWPASVRSRTTAKRRRVMYTSKLTRNTKQGEIDIMESRGNAAGYSAGGVDTFGSWVLSGALLLLSQHLRRSQKSNLTLLCDAERSISAPSTERTAMTSRTPRRRRGAVEISLKISTFLASNGLKT